MSALADALPLLTGLALAGSLLAALLGLFTARRRRLVQALAFGSLGAGGLAGTAAGAALLAGAPGFQAVLPIGLPWLRLHLQLDGLGGLFLALIGMVTVAASLFGRATCVSTSGAATRPACSGWPPACSSPACSSWCWPPMPSAS
jgi:formate hydrogenlyase subunit 3/multisubunit Na+/H+ antiporter MnhD subunit